MNKLRAMRSVYSYYFPEIRQLISGLTKKYPHEVFLRSVSPGLDDFHSEIIEQYQNYIKTFLPGLNDFKYRYYTNGSSEGIFHLLVCLKMNYPRLPIYVFKGEYEGYRQYASQLHKEVKEVDYETNPKKLSQGFWFISNPSARDGNIIPNEKIIRICQAGHKVILDATYVGSTRQHVFDIKNPNIFGIVISLSKPLGLFYYRIGFTFTREEVGTLYPNIWFKNIFSLLVAKEIFEKYNCHYFYDRYRPIQLKIVREIRKETGFPVEPSDSLLLGYINNDVACKLDENQLKKIERFCRGEFYRFCLTPYFLERES